jgi:hypothetical protein
MYKSGGPGTTPGGMPDMSGMDMAKMAEMMKGMNMGGGGTPGKMPNISEID